VDLPDEIEGSTTVLRQVFTEAMECKNPQGQRAERLSPSVDPFGCPNSLSSAQDTVDFLGHPFRLRQDPVFLQLTVD
jgi:hypothetical protein